MARWGNRAAVKALVDSHFFQRPFIFLVLFDLVLVSAEGQLGYLGAAFGVLADLVHYVLQLALFLELVGLIMVHQWDFFSHPWFLLDVVLFIGTALVEGFHHEDGANAARITLRAWRLIRVIHAIAVAVELEWHEAAELAELRSEVSDLRRENNILQAQIIQLGKDRQASVDPFHWQRGGARTDEAGSPLVRNR